MNQIINMGCNSEHDIHFVTNRPKGWDCYIMLFIKTPFYFYIGGEKRKYDSNHFILIDRNTSFHYGATEDYYCDDWMQFYSSSNTLKLYNIPFNKPIPEVPLAATYFSLIEEIFIGANANREKICSQLMDSLLSYISGTMNFPKSNVPFYNEFSTIRHNIYAHPEKEWSLEDISRTAGLSRSYFQQKYKDFFHVSCGSDIINSRISQAKIYLKDTLLSIQEIADFCGYHSEVHFSRQFKKEVGITPSAYRVSSNDSD